MKKFVEIKSKNYYIYGMNEEEKQLAPIILTEPKAVLEFLLGARKSGNHIWTVKHIRMSNVPFSVKEEGLFCGDELLGATSECGFRFMEILTTNPVQDVYILIPNKEPLRDIMTELRDAAALVDLGGYKSISLTAAARMKGVTVMTLRYRIKSNLLTTCMVRSKKTKRMQTHIVMDRKFHQYYKGSHSMKHDN